MTQLIADNNSHDTVIVNSLLLEVNYYYLNNPDTAMTLCKKALSIAEKIEFFDGMSDGYGWLAYLLESVGDIEQSLIYSYKGLKLFELTGQKKEMAKSLNNIGFVYYNQGDLDQALKLFEQSLAVKQEIDDQPGIAMSYNNMAIVYGDSGDIDKELDYFNKSLEIYLLLADKQGQATCYNNMASVYNELKDPIGALKFHQMSLDIRKETGDRQGEAISYVNIGRIYLEMGNLKSALEFGEKAYEISNDIGFPEEIKEAALLLSEVYEKQNLGSKALEMYKLHISMRDSILNESNIRAISEEQLKYEYEKKKVLDQARNDKLLALEQEEKEKQRIISWSIGIGLVLVLLFLFFVFNRLNITRRQKQIIELTNSELKEKNKEITDSINYAKRIQTAILPSPKILTESLKNSFVLYIPKDIVAGDFYWLLKVVQDESEIILFAVADCTGHGVPGAMVSVICNSALNRSVKEYGLTDPGKILDKTRELVIEEFQKSSEDVKDGMDIALCSLVQKGNEILLQYAGANNPLWILRNEEIIEIKADKQPIGKFAHQTAYTCHSVKLEKNDSLYIFSDGIVDQFGGEFGKKYKAKQLRELLIRINQIPVSNQAKEIERSFIEWKGDLEQVDDICIMGVKI